MSTFDYISEPLTDLEYYKDFIEGVGLYLEQIKREDGDWFTAQDDYDNRIKATVATGLMETNTLLHDIALSLRVLSGRDNKDA